MHRLLLLLLVLLIVVGIFGYLRKHWKKANEAQKKIDWSKVNRDLDDEDDDDDWGEPPAKP